MSAEDRIQAVIISIIRFLKQAAENRMRRGIPSYGHELTEEEKRQEIWRILFNVIFDFIGVH